MRLNDTNENKQTLMRLNDTKNISVWVKIRSLFCIFVATN